MMYWHDGGWGPGAWIMMALMMLLFWTAIAGVLVVVLRSHRDAPSRDNRATNSAAQILDERFARGDIDVDEYTRRREVLLHH